MSEIFQQRQSQSQSKAIFQNALSGAEDGEGFDAEESTGEHPSLRSYLSKRIFQNTLEPAAPKPGPLLFKLPAESNHTSAQVLNGNRINSLDSQMASGLEQYLPSPAIRLRITKERLEKEISGLQIQVARYHAIQDPPPDLGQKIQELQGRLTALKEHGHQIDIELEALYTNSSVLFRVVTVLQTMQNRSAQFIQDVAQRAMPETWLRQLNPTRYKLVTLNQRLSDLTNVLRAQTDIGIPSSMEVQTLVSEYDQLLQEVEKVAAQLRHKKTPWERLSDRLNQWYYRLTR
jgi:chromosome segregation ATPase